MARKVHSADFKFRVALEALKGAKTINEIAKEFGIHPNQVSQWKRKLATESVELFSRRRDQAWQEHEELQARLYEEIGRLKIELDWLKKKV